MLSLSTLKAFIQYERSRDAEEARYALHGQNVYNGCCNLQIQRAKQTSFDVKYNDDVGLVHRTGELFRFTRCLPC